MSRLRNTQASQIPVEDPVLCASCGALFGEGAEASTVCPYCTGELRPIPEARRIMNAHDHTSAAPGGAG